MEQAMADRQLVYPEAVLRLICNLEQAFSWRLKNACEKEVTKRTEHQGGVDSHEDVPITYADLERALPEVLRSFRGMSRSELEELSESDWDDWPNRTSLD